MDGSTNLKMYKVEEIVKFTGCSKTLINKLIGLGALKAVRFGGTHRVLEKDFLEFIQKGGTPKESRNFQAYKKGGGNN